MLKCTYGTALWDLYKGNKDAMGRAYRTFRTGVGAMLTVGTAGAKDKTDAIRQKWNTWQRCLVQFYGFAKEMIRFGFMTDDVMRVPLGHPAHLGMYGVHGLGNTLACWVPQKMERVFFGDETDICSGNDPGSGGAHMQMFNGNMQRLLTTQMKSGKISAMFTMTLSRQQLPPMVMFKSAMKPDTPHSFPIPTCQALEGTDYAQTMRCGCIHRNLDGSIGTRPSLKTMSLDRAEASSHDLLNGLDDRAVSTAFPGHGDAVYSGKVRGFCAERSEHATGLTAVELAQGKWWLVEFDIPTEEEDPEEAAAMDEDKQVGQHLQHHHHHHHHYRP